MGAESLMGLIAGLGGGVLESVGGFMSGQSEKDAANKMRRILSGFFDRMEQRQDKIYRQESEKTGAALTQSRRQEARAMLQSQQRADADLYNLMASPAYQAQSGYLMQLFEKGIPDSIANEYAGRMRTAQAARGTYWGGAPAKDEAAMLTKLAEEGRMNALAGVRQMAFDPLTVQQGSVQNYLQQLGAAQGYGTGGLQNSLTALTTAAQLMGARTSGLQQIGAQLYGQMPVSAANPLANLLGGLGSTLGNLGNVAAGRGSW